MLTAMLQILHSQLIWKIQKKIKSAQDSITDVDFILKEIANQRDVLNVQKQMMMNNKLLLAAMGSDSLQLLQQD